MALLDHSVIGKYVLSQRYQAPFIVHGVAEQTTEHWMMAEKAVLFQDTEISKKKKYHLINPERSKSWADRSGILIRPSGTSTKYDIVKTGNIHKVQHQPEIERIPAQHGNRVLVEASPTDPVWGNGLAQHTNQIENPHTWKGLNLLGFFVNGGAGCLVPEALVAARDMGRIRCSVWSQSFYLRW